MSAVEISPITRCSPLALRTAVEAFARRHQRDHALSEPLYEAAESELRRAYTAYLLREGGCDVGAVCFRTLSDDPEERAILGIDMSACWFLSWHWIEPQHHDRLLAEAWPFFERRHGRFLIASDPPPALRRFLEAQHIEQDRIIYLSEAA